MLESRAGARDYARHQLEKTLLYQVVLGHLSTFLSEMAATGRTGIEVCVQTTLTLGELAAVDGSAR